jgi:hypothetical protein
VCIGGGVIEQREVEEIKARRRVKERVEEKKLDQLSSSLRK